LEAVFQLISATTDGVFAVDRRQRIVLWNDGAKAILGHNAKDVLGRNCYRVVPADDSCCENGCGRNCSAMRAALAGRSVPTRDIAARTRDGRTVCLNMSTMRVPSDWQDLSVLVHVFRDVTTHKEVEHVVRDMIDRVSGAIPERRSKEISTIRNDEPTLDLTDREREILRQLSTGASTETIARRLGISPTTVRNHIQSVLGKLGVHSRLEAVTYSLRNGLL
jgi:PAS domain S-box-containing protein